MKIPQIEIDVKETALTRTLTGCICINVIKSSLLSEFITSLFNKLQDYWIYYFENDDVCKLDDCPYHPIFNKTIKICEDEANNQNGNEDLEQILRNIPSIDAISKELNDINPTVYSNNDKLEQLFSQLSIHSKVLQGTSATEHQESILKNSLVVLKSIKKIHMIIKESSRIYPIQYYLKIKQKEENYDYTDPDNFKEFW